MSVACPRVVPDRRATLRQWIAIQRTRGDLGTQMPALLERLAVAIDAAAGWRLQNISLDPDRIVVEQTDGAWMCHLPSANPDERRDPSFIQARLARMLRQCLEPEIAKCSAVNAIDRLQAALRRGEHGTAAARFGSCVEFARAVAAELAPLSCSRRRPVADVAPLIVTERSRQAKAAVHRRNFPLVTAGCVLLGCTLSLIGCQCVARLSPHSKAIAASLPSAVQFAETLESRVRLRASKKPESVDTGEGLVDASRSSEKPTAYDNVAPEPADDPAGSAGTPASRVYNRTAAIPDGESCALPGSPHPQSDSTARLPVPRDDGGHGMPVSVTLLSGAVVSPSEVLARIDVDQAKGRRLMGSEGIVLTALDSESDAGNGGHRINFRTGCRNGICELQAGGLLRASWTTSDEDFDGKRCLVRSCGQFVRGSDGVLLRDGAWLTWNEVNETLTVAEYDHGECLQVTTCRGGVEEKQSVKGTWYDDLAGAARFSCPGFDGIEAIAQAVQTGVARHSAAVRARRRESEEAESQRVAVVRLHEIQQSRAAAYAAMMASMPTVCHPSRAPLMGCSNGCGRELPSYPSGGPPGWPVYANSGTPMPAPPPLSTSRLSP